MRSINKDLNDHHPFRYSMKQIETSTSLVFYFLLYMKLVECYSGTVNVPRSWKNHTAKCSLPFTNYNCSKK